MELVIRKSPVVRTRNNKLFRQLSLLGGLVAVLIASLVLSSNVGKALAITGSVLATTAVIECLYALSCKELNKFKNWKNYLGPAITALTMALVLPLEANWYIAIIAAAVATYLGKLVFGGEGRNIFNPAMLGYGIALVSFKFSDSHYLSGLKEIVTTGTTGMVFELGELLFGNHVGIGIGVTCSVLLLALLVYYAIAKVIDWKISCTYLVTCAAMTLITFSTAASKISLNMDVFQVTLCHMLVGGILFASVFLLPDDPSSPTTRESKILYATIAGIFTMAVRFIGGYGDGVVFGVLLANMLAPLLSSSFKRSNKKNLIIVIAVCVLLVVCLSLVLGVMVKHNIKVGGAE